ncbi:MAG: VOC family protein [Flavobacteriales bacterium]
MMKRDYLIAGIQQVGIGVPDVQEIWSWYRRSFGMDLRIFEEAAPAPLMTRYTGGEIHSRTATLAMSLNGGGGFEIWQFTSRATEKAIFDIQLGDLGLYSCKIKSSDVMASFQYMQALELDILNEPTPDPNGKLSFFVKDPNGNIFQIVDGRSWFSHTNHPSHCGGVAGVLIGVSDMEKSMKLYRDILGYELEEMDVTSHFNDLIHLPGSNGRFRRVRLTHPTVKNGSFSELLGITEIELIQSLDRTDVKKIFENRFWGDWGYIHLCFDVQGMDALELACKTHGFNFTVDSKNSFQMGEASGRFSYIEDPDGAWIEFVETHKVPIVKKIGWYVKLHPKRKWKHLPKWMLLALKFNRVKD